MGCSSQVPDALPPAPQGSWQAEPVVNDFDDYDDVSQPVEPDATTEGVEPHLDVPPENVEPQRVNIANSLTPDFIAMHVYGWFPKYMQRYVMIAIAVRSSQTCHRQHEHACVR